MMYTFIYAAETDRGPAAIKFESKSQDIREFDVTILSDPEIQPFKIVLDQGEWRLPRKACDKIRSIGREITEAARKFQR